MPEFVGALVGSIIGSWTFLFMYMNDFFGWDTDDEDEDY